MILVTGATGFVGSALCRRMSDQQRPVIAATRAESVATGLANLPHVTCRIAPDLMDHTAGQQWMSVLSGCRVVVHTAAMVHVMNPTAQDDQRFTQINVQGTLALARAAVDSGVKRFVYLSTVKVHGERTQLGKPFTANQALCPSGAYAISKYEAEQGLRQLALQTGLEVVVIRPPLIYGPGASGNLGLLMRWLARGVPLPIGAMDQNARSLVGIDNLVDLILTTVDHPAAANHAFLVSDDHDLSTLALVRLIGQAGGLPVRTVKVPIGLLRVLAALLGKSSYIERLVESLQVDIAQTKRLLGWSAPVSVKQAMTRLFEKSPPRHG